MNPFNMRNFRLFTKSHGKTCNTEAKSHTCFSHITGRLVRQQWWQSHMWKWGRALKPSKSLSMGVFWTS
jgi:hypothetical protein